MPLQLTSDPPHGFIPPRYAKPGPAFVGFHTEQRWIPPVNLYETDDHYSVCVDLAGVDKDRIDVEVIGYQLRLSGHRPVPSDFGPSSHPPPDTAPVGTPARRCRVHVMEIDHGAFERRVELPADALADHITARYREGFLWIDIPRRPRTG